MKARNESIFFKTIILSVALLVFSLSFPGTASAGELENIEELINDLTARLNMSLQATAPLEENLDKLERDLQSLEKRISILSEQLKQKEIQLEEKDKLLQKQQALLEKRIRAFYKKSAQFFSSGLQLLINSQDLAKTTQLVSYNQSVLSKDRNEIVQLVLFIKNMEEKKVKLGNDKKRLASAEKEVNKQAQFLRKEIKGAKAYQSQLKVKIAQLTARQQSILAERLNSLNLPVSLGAGALYCTDDRNLNPGFSPAFAFYTYGIPHRVGMNQYGAYGRAKNGQGYQDILRAYFNNIDFQGGRENTRIKVQGYGEMGLEDYLLGIYEMPGSWPLEALKAQAVAARSYALAYTNNGQGEICTTQACQVYKGGNKGGDWERAVKETKGQIMMSGGQIVKAWYSSTDGGYTFTSGDVWGSNKPWTKRLIDVSGSVNSFADLQSKAYDKESPCFYAAQGWRAQYNKSAWLKQEEVADIINVLMLVKRDSGAGEHLYQTDKPHPYGGEIWDAERVKNELRSRGATPFNNISNVSVGADFKEGRTTSVNVSGDAGSQSFSGQEFKNYFNLRAPANIQIVGPLFNVERK